MAKTPKDIPTKAGQFVVWRGRDKRGLVTKIDHTWVWVTWENLDGPLICHVNELVVENK